MTDKFRFKRAATIKVPDEFFNPLCTGLRAVDESWSEIGGIVPSQVTFITGNPGAGKTTLSLAIASAVVSKGPVGFISLEMSDFQLAHQAKKIPGFGGIDVTGDFDQEETIKALELMKPKLIILDSIQKAARKMKLPDGKQMPHDRAQFEIVSLFTEYAKRTWTPVFLIGHCDKSGNYKGPSDLLHDVDSHLIVHYDKEMELRTFTFGKNRFGGVVEENLFGITRDQVWIGSPYLTTKFADAVITPTSATPVEPVPTEDPDNTEVVNSCLSLLETKWDGSTARATINAVIQKLKNEDPDFVSDSVIKDPKRVKVDFRGNSLAHCHSASGEIVFGKKTFTSGLVVGYVGYAKEQKFIKPRVTNKSDMLVWIIIHEWCHLYKGMQNHKNEFFEFVAKKYDWFQSVR
jgi:hypothetical protein